MLLRGSGDPTALDFSSGGDYEKWMEIDLIERGSAIGRTRKPAITVIVLSIAVPLTGLNFRFPVILEALRRSPAAVSSGEWWRLITPVFIDRGGGLEIAFNLLSLGIVGVIAERILGSRRWLLFYLLGGVVGEGVGLVWKPMGAGSSVAVFGLVGALAAWLLMRKESWQARLGGASLILWALILTAFRNLHGPPLLVCAGLAGFILLREARRAPSAPVP
jgi:membrane associated rhomboid family serine protease